jgi:hypothetical protein
MPLPERRPSLDRHPCVALWLLCGLTLLMRTSPALACGVSGPDGVWSCSIEEHEEAERPRWSLGAVGSYTWTRLNFQHGLRVRAQRSAALINASYAPTKVLRIQASAGVAGTGTLATPDGTYDFSPGAIGAVGVSYRFLTGRPFLVLSGLLSASSAQTELRDHAASAARYTALDIRAGLAFGATFFDALSPYAVVRTFGGPIFWHYRGQSVLGTDRYHVQLGAGVAYRIAGRVDAFVEGIPLGERAFSGGAAVLF